MPLEKEDLSPLRSRRTVFALEHDFFFHLAIKSSMPQVSVCRYRPIVDVCLFHTTNITSARKWASPKRLPSPRGFARQRRRIPVTHTPGLDEMGGELLAKSGQTVHTHTHAHPPTLLYSRLCLLDIAILSGTRIAVPLQSSHHDVAKGRVASFGLFGRFPEGVGKKGPPPYLSAVLEKFPTPITKFKPGDFS